MKIPFLIKDIDSQIYGEPEDTKSKKNNTK
jgi:hypothetical protein